MHGLQFTNFCTFPTLIKSFIENLTYQLCNTKHLIIMMFGQQHQFAHEEENPIQIIVLSYQDFYKQLKHRQPHNMTYWEIQVTFTGKW